MSSEISKEIKEIYTKIEFYNAIAEEGIFIAIIDYIAITICIIFFSIIPIIPLMILNEKSKEKFKEYKCTGKYKEEKEICKKCDYKEECKKGY